jgi:hypothetical protein
MCSVLLDDKVDPLVKTNKCNYSGSKFQGSRLPWRDLICILGTITLNATIDVSTQWDREARSGPGVQG